MTTLGVIEHVRVGRPRHRQSEGEPDTDVPLLQAMEGLVLEGVPTVPNAAGRRHSGTGVDLVSLSPPGPLCSEVY